MKTVIMILGLGLSLNAAAKVNTMVSQPEYVHAASIIELVLNYAKTNQLVAQQITAMPDQASLVTPCQDNSTATLVFTVQSGCAKSFDPKLCRPERELILDEAKSTSCK